MEQRYRDITIRCEIESPGKIRTTARTDKGLVPENMRDSYLFSCEPGEEEAAEHTVFNIMCKKYDEAIPVAKAVEATTNEQLETSVYKKEHNKKKKLIIICAITAIVSVALALAGAMLTKETPKSYHSKLGVGDMTVDLLDGSTYEDEFTAYSDTDTIAISERFFSSEDDISVSGKATEETRVEQYATEYIEEDPNVESVSEIEKITFEGAEKTIDSYHCNVKYNSDGDIYNISVYFIPFKDSVYSVAIGALEGTDTKEEEWLKGVRIKGYKSQAEIEAEEARKAEEEKKTEEKKKEMSYEETDLGFEYYENSIGDIEYYAFVEITNTGSVPIYLKECTFDFEDANGHLLESEDWIDSCPDVVLPGEKGYFRNDAFSSLLDSNIPLDGIRLVPKYEIVEATIEPVFYEISDTDIRVDESLGTEGVKVTGRITNNTSVDEPHTYVDVVFYDDEGKCIGLTGTTITDLSSGETQSFECTTTVGNENITMDRVADYKVFAQKKHIEL